MVHGFGLRYERIKPDAPERFAQPMLDGVSDAASHRTIDLDESSPESLFSCEIALFRQLLMVGEREGFHGHDMVELGERFIYSDEYVSKMTIATLTSSTKGDVPYWRSRILS